MKTKKPIPLEQFKDSVITAVILARERNVSTHEIHATLELLNSRLIWRLPELERMAESVKKRK